MDREMPQKFSPGEVFSFEDNIYVCVSTVNLSQLKNNPCQAVHIASNKDQTLVKCAFIGKHLVCLKFNCQDVIFCKLSNHEEFHPITKDLPAKTRRLQIK